MLGWECERKGSVGNLNLFRSMRHVPLKQDAALLQIRFKMLVQHH
jgi:hypothetical protein